MSTPTWGVYIPGYSYPSVAQRKKFDRIYPGVAATLRSEREHSLKRVFDDLKQRAAEDRKQQAACTHLFVPTNVGDAHVCRRCMARVKTLADVFADLA